MLLTNDNLAGIENEGNERLKESHEFEESFKDK